MIYTTNTGGRLSIEQTIKGNLVRYGITYAELAKWMTKKYKIVTITAKLNGHRRLTSDDIEEIKAATGRIRQARKAR